MAIGSFAIRLPSMQFRIRTQTQQSPGFQWDSVTSDSLFANKRVIIVGMPGAFNPTCSSNHLPGYEANYSELLSHNIQEVYVVSVNDSFVMNSWFENLDIRNVKAVPDGSGDFTRMMGMMVKKDHQGMGYRSWRYAVIADNMLVERMFIEPGFSDDFPADPLGISSAHSVLEYLTQVNT